MHLVGNLPRTPLPRPGYKKMTLSLGAPVKTHAGGASHSRTPGRSRPPQSSGDGAGSLPGRTAPRRRPHSQGGSRQAEAGLGGGPVLRATAGCGAQVTPRVPRRVTLSLRSPPRRLSRSSGRTRSGGRFFPLRRSPSGPHPSSLQAPSVTPRGPFPPPAPLPPRAQDPPTEPAPGSDLRRPAPDRPR